MRFGLDGSSSILLASDSTIGRHEADASGSTHRCLFSPHAAGVIQTCGDGVDAYTGPPNGLHLLSLAGREVAARAERLGEPGCVRRATACKLRALDPVEP